MIGGKRITEIRDALRNAEFALCYLPGIGYYQICATRELGDLLGEIESLQTMLDATTADQETPQKEIGRLIDLAGNWKEAADQYHAERNDLQAQLAESQRREQAADKCYNCDYKATVGCHCPYATWRGPQEAGDRP